MAGDTGSGASRADRVSGRLSHGYRPRTLYTRVGPVTLLVPQTREGAFSTEIFKRYQRSEQAFVLGVDGNGRAGRVDTEGLGDHRGNCAGRAFFSKSTVSALCAEGWTHACGRSTSPGGWKAPPTRSFWSMRCSSKAGKATASFTRPLVVSGIRSGLSRDSRREDRRHRELRHLGRDFPLAQGPWSARGDVRRLRQPRG